ncbi:MAG TPA: aminoglycoside phosphotransferase family protein [Chloroflexaceae bacterium]|nr:aminoglycoside phosphotransferase family protein [Chloroflexaceae bacterium]
MHADEVPTDVGLVRRLLAAQFPEWAGLPITPIPSAGTDNAIYRLGDDKAVRLPRIHWAAGQIAKERTWLPRLGPHLPLELPVQLAVGAPDAGYPYEWGVYRWLAGDSAADAPIASMDETAVVLAQFITALQWIEPTGGPDAVGHSLRGVPLRLRDAGTRAAIAAMGSMIDASAALRVWDEALRAPEWDRPPVWFHGDLLPGNLLVTGGRLSAVIDWSGLGVGDPTCDLMCAWALFSGQSRQTFRDALAVDDATWARAKGQALSQAVIFIPYYLHTNPIGVARARRMLREVLADTR